VADPFSLPIEWIPDENRLLVDAIRTWAKALMELSFRAARDGMQTTLLDTGRLRPAGNIAAELISDVRPLARELGIEDPLDEVRWLIETCGGANRHRHLSAQRGMAALLELLVEETSGRA